MSNAAPTVLSSELQLLRNQILTALREGVCSVVFTKSDSTERTMRCTLQAQYLPTFPEPDTVAIPRTNSTVAARPRTPLNVSVWDLEKNAFRSFNLSNIIRWEQEDQPTEQKR
jgi:hypothetical protein